jgi:predicted ABC-type sugar transport system permease subunit
VTSAEATIPGSHIERLGGFVVAVIYNAVILLGLGAAGQFIWTGFVLLAAVLLDALARRAPPARPTEPEPGWPAPAGGIPGMAH